MQKRLTVGCTAVLLMLGACGADHRGDHPDPVSSVMGSFAPCRPPAGSQPGADPVTVVESLYPGAFVFVNEHAWSAPGHALIDVAEGGEVVAELALTSMGGMWEVTCVSEGDFSSEAYPVPE